MTCLDRELEYSSNTFCLKRFNFANRRYCIIGCSLSIIVLHRLSLLQLSTVCFVLNTKSFASCVPSATDLTWQIKSVQISLQANNPNKLRRSSHLLDVVSFESLRTKCSLSRNKKSRLPNMRNINVTAEKYRFQAAV